MALVTRSRPRTLVSIICTQSSSLPSASGCSPAASPALLIKISTCGYRVSIVRTNVWMLLRSRTSRGKRRPPELLRSAAGAVLPTRPEHQGEAFAGEAARGCLADSRARSRHNGDSFRGGHHLMVGGTAGLTVCPFLVTLRIISEGVFGQEARGRNGWAPACRHARRCIVAVCRLRSTWWCRAGGRSMGIEPGGRGAAVPRTNPASVGLGLAPAPPPPPATPHPDSPPATHTPAPPPTH